MFTSPAVVISLFLPKIFNCAVFLLFYISIVFKRAFRFCWCYITVKFYFHYFTLVCFLLFYLLHSFICARYTFLFAKHLKLCDDFWEGLKLKCKRQKKKKNNSKKILEWETKVIETLELHISVNGIALMACMLLEIVGFPRKFDIFNDYLGVVVVFLEGICSRFCSI